MPDFLPAFVSRPISFNYASTNVAKRWEREQDCETMVWFGVGSVWSVCAWFDRGLVWFVWGLVWCVCAWFGLSGAWFGVSVPGLVCLGLGLVMGLAWYGLETGLVWGLASFSFQFKAVYNLQLFNPKSKKKKKKTLFL